MDMLEAKVNAHAFPQCGKPPARSGIDNRPAYGGELTVFLPRASKRRTYDRELANEWKKNISPIREQLDRFLGGCAIQIPEVNSKVPTAIECTSPVLVAVHRSKSFPAYPD